MTHLKIQSRTITSKAAQAEIAALSGAVKFVKRHVPELGYVLFCKNAAGITVAQAVKDGLGVQVTLK